MPFDSLKAPFAAIPDALRVRNAGILYAYVLLIAVFAVGCAATGRPSYLSGTNVANILDQASLLSILVIFSTVVLLSANFDLSVASSAALSGAVMLSLLGDVGFVPAILLGVGCGVVIGIINAVIVEYVEINAFIVTLGTLTAVRGIVLIVTDGRTITVTDPAAYENFATIQAGTWTIPNVALLLAVVSLIGGVGTLLIRRRAASRARVGALVGAGIALAAIGAQGGWSVTLTKPVYYLGVTLLVMWAVLRFTVVGRRLYAVGGNAEAARLSGIRVRRYKIMPFVLSGLAAGVVGVLYAAKQGAVNPTALQGAELTVLAAAILGGTSLFGGQGSVVNATIGSLFLFTIANGFNVLNLGANYQGLIQGVIIVIAAGVYTVAAKRYATRSVGREFDDDDDRAMPDPAHASVSPPDAAAERSSLQSSQT